MKEKLPEIIIMLAIVISVIIFTEIAVFANANTYFLPQNQGCFGNDRTLASSTPSFEALSVANELEENAGHKSILKDSDYKLAFVTPGGLEEINLEEYLIGVVMAEVPYTFEYEAIKAQAVAARTYAIYITTIEPRHEKNTVCDLSGHCSGYLSKDEYIGKYGENAYNKGYELAKKAVNDTDGQVITYNGSVCCAVYHASSYGSTENSYNLWKSEIPYLKSVVTPETDNVSKLSVTINDMRRFLSYYGEPHGDAGDISHKYNDSGRCESIEIAGVRVLSSKLREYFGLRSCDLTLTFSDDTYTFTTYGYGHGIGMSQVGANLLAKQNMSYFDILTHYYTDVIISQY